MWRSSKQTCLVGPLEVVEDDDDGLVLRHLCEQTHHGGEEQEPLGVGVGGLGGRQVRDATGEGGCQLRTVPTHGRRRE